MQRSRILDILGEEMFATMTAVSVPGRVIWRNAELTRGLTDDDLVDALSYRLLRPGEAIKGRETVTLHADHYGGDGIAPFLGSARAGFLPYGDILLKGIGLTPLFRKPREEDFPHTHGGCNLNEAMAEAIHGEISRRLFSREPARILAIIDQDDWTVYPDGVTKHPRVILARVGLQLRPAHVLAKIIREQGRCAEMFERITRATGQWREDLRATMLQVIDDHAHAVAEQVRWRITHGCISTSNMLMSGGMLDTVIQCAHPRIADIVPRTKNPDRVFFRDYPDRTKQMVKVWRVLRAEQHLAPLDVWREMEARYRHHLDAMFLDAAGFATDIRESHPQLTRNFADVLVDLAALRNLSSFPKSRALVKDHAVVDIFSVLAGGKPKPVYRGNPHHIARKRRAVRTLMQRFHELRAELAKIAAPRAIEHPPLENLYRTPLWEDLDASAMRYRETNDAALIEELIAGRIATSSWNGSRPEPWTMIGSDDDDHPSDRPPSPRVEAPLPP